VAFFHGGYWRRLDKSDFSFVAAGLVPLGVSVAAINYGLVPETPLPEIVSQCRRAIAWLTANAGELQVDPERISALGHSAGGHLAAMTAVAFGLRSEVSISGLHDLLPVQQSFANEWLRLDERQARALSPVAHPPIGRVPVFATAGELESEAFKLQSRSLVDAWAPLGCPAEYAESPGDDHFSICLRLRNPADGLTRRVASLAAA
jgi:arylformamidase